MKLALNLKWHRHTFHDVRNIRHGLQDIEQTMEMIPIK